MSVKSYKYNDKTQLSEHFNVQEFRCKCGGKHNILIDTELVNTLEKAIKQLGAKTCNITSGHRCSKHDKKVGGKGAGNHVEGKAADHYFKYANGKRIDGKTVCLAYEDMGHKKGIAYRCGGSSPDKGIVHADVSNRKWYGDESVSMTYSIGDSFYTYFGIKKKSNKTSNNKKYIKINAKSGVWCRKGCGLILYRKYKLIPLYSKCELLVKNYKTASGYKWDKIIYKGEVVYLPNNWNKYL